MTGERSLRNGGAMSRVESIRLFWVLLFAFTTTAFSQTSSTSLQGTVTDPSGSAIIGATVVVSNEAKLERATVTDAQGGYRLLALPPGTYTLVVTAKGFARYQQTDLQLLVNTPATANVQLKVGGATEVVQVSGEAPVLNMVDASLGNSFDELAVKETPLEGRNVPDLLSLQAGVAYTGNRPDINKDQDTRSGAVNGARSDQSNVTLDGVDVNDQANGYAFTSVLPVTLDSVQEFRVTTANYNADQGEGSGAQVALVTKSGTNRFHGSLYEYNRNTATSASDYFLQAPPKLNRNIFGASLGGPIQKSRAFFFVNYEGTRRREQNSVVRNIPTPSFLDGVIQYQCADTNANGSNLDECPNSASVLGLSGKSYSYQPGFFALGPNEINSFDPGGPQDGGSQTIKGPNLALLNSYFIPTFSKFTPNDLAVGDGLNYSGYLFGAPIKYDNNAFIARFDYRLTADGRHTLFWRGGLQNPFNPEEPFLPGTDPVHTLSDHSKGFAVGYTAVLTPTLVNSFHWGFTRQSFADVGNSDSKGWNTFYTLDQGFTYSRNFRLPVHNFLDDVSWTKDSHTLQFGGNVGIARDPRVSFQHSFNTALGATFWMSPVGFANTGGQSPLDPVNGGFPEPASSIQYDYPLLGLLGMVSDVKANLNYDKQGNTLAQGTPIKRDYGLNWYEFYGQDSWRIRPNLTVTYGLRWSLFPPPWEVNGLQASPTFDLGKYFDQNVQNMKKGLGYADNQLVSFVLGGPANHGAGFYHFEKSNFSPRISVAFSPRPGGGWLRKIFGEGDKTVVRAGFGRVYDRAGMELLSMFDANSPGGLSATVQNPCCLPGITDAANVPRVTDVNSIPLPYLTNQLPDGVLPPGQFPQTPNPAGEAITWGVDQSLRTPYAYTIDFSVGRALSKGFALQLSYVGRLGRNLLTQRDLMQPLNLVDPKSGVDYFKAATALSRLARNGVDISQVTAGSVGQTAAFWQNLIAPLGSSTPGLAPGASVYLLPTGGTTTDVVQAVYALYVTSGAYAGDEVVGLANTDIYYLLADDQANSYFFNGKVGELLNNQLTSMYAWSSIGKSNYNALQVNLKKQAGHGMQFDLNYTYSKSIDYTSGAARLGFSPSDNIGAPGSRLVNAFDPRAVRAVSDFDATHQINANWIVELPFGKGRHFAGNASPALDAVVGGWQLSGLARWTTGFPFTVDNGQFWPTDWDEQGSAQLIAKPKTGAFKQPDGTVSIFADPSAALNDFIHPFPGGGGSRNVLRGQGYAGWDMGLSKRWRLPFEGHSLQFRWEVFNVPNLHRFNVAAGLGDNAPSLQQLPQSFGDYTGLLTQPRVMQFALRYEF